MASARAGAVAATVVAAILALAAGWLYVALRHAQEAQQQLAAEQAALKKDMQKLRERAAAKAELAAQKDKRIESLLAEQNSLQDKLAKKDELEMQAQGLREQNAALAQKLAETAAKAHQASAAHASAARELSATAKTLEDAKARSAELNRAYEALLQEKSELAATSAARRAELARIKAAFEQAQSEVARLTGARGIYTVQDGDSLSKIAAFFYHHATRWPDILRANSHLIDKPDLIYPKQVLIIPK